MRNQHRRRRTRTHVRRSSAFDTVVLVVIVFIGLVYVLVQYELDAYIGEVFATTVFAAAGLLAYGIVRWWVRITRYLHQQEKEAQIARRREIELLYSRMHPYVFERFVGFILLHEGGVGVEQVTRSGDGSIDFTMEYHGAKVCVTVKRGHVASSTNALALETFVHSYTRSKDAGWYLTLGTFTNDAQVYAASVSSLRIIDGTEFTHMIERLPSERWREEYVVSSH